MERFPGQFTPLQNIPYFRHGFSIGYPSIGFQNYANTPASIQAHKDFLRDYEMGSYEKAIMIKANGTPVTFVDTLPEKDPEVPFYSYIQGECIVTPIKGYSFNIKLADCAGFIGTVLAKDGTELLLLLHGSRNSLANKFWVESIRRAREKYQFDPSEIKGGVTPHICAQCHTLHNLDQLPYAAQWKEEGIASQDTQGLWHFDSTTFLKKQLQEAGVRLENVSIETRCTYEVYTKAIEENTQPPLYSHRSYNDHQSDSRYYNGRFVLTGLLV